MTYEEVATLNGALILASTILFGFGVVDRGKKPYGPACIALGALLSTVRLGLLFGETWVMAVYTFVAGWAAAVAVNRRKGRNDRSASLPVPEETPR